MSGLFNTIRDGVNNGVLQQPFNVRMVNESCNDVLIRSRSFLSKHRLGNPGGYTVYFERFSNDNGDEIRGLYQLITTN